MLRLIRVKDLQGAGHNRPERPSQRRVLPVDETHGVAFEGQMVLSYERPEGNEVLPQGW